MAEKDFTTNTPKEVKEALTRIERVGKILKNISQIRAISCEDTPETELVSFTYQQISEFAVTIDVAAETLAHHFKGQSVPEPKPEAEQKKSGPSQEAIDGALTSVFQQTALFEGMKAMLEGPANDLELNLLHLIKMADRAREEIFNQLAM